ncbi:glycosyltransferase family 4 protein [Reyranella sp.]|uniref:glycosyltransferase family 4 protein n=1 Tax=Reyranella sp. TaxID=1929291 RepID=UPI0011F59041|nr:glycosyltransferase family 4 protein [Reyranella sp.]TAJ87526.1 MAG: glycosyltransferase [Reyranella sp.]
MASRILALVGDCYGARGGIARYNQDLFESLADGSVEILILPRLGDAAGLTLPRGIRQATAIFNRLGFSIAALVAAWRFRPVDVVFCGHVFMAPLAFVLSRLLGARYWLQTHGTDVWNDQRSLTRRLIEAADMVSTVSRETRRILLAWVNLPPDRVRVLPDTVQDVFTPGPPRPAFRDSLKLGPGPILLTVARLAASERYKGHEPVFAVLPALREKYPDLVHVVAGDGDDRARLEAAAARMAPGIVRFLGYVPDADLPDLYRLADLYVMPSTEEGFGIVYLEAAACGLRVVGGRGGGTADAIPDERVGAIVDPADREALVNTIVCLLGQGRADSSAVEPYRRSHFAAAARALYARLVAQPRRKKSGI